MKTKENTRQNAGFVAEPLIGIEPMIYALRACPMRCSRVQSPHLLQIQRVLLLAIIGC